MANSPDPDFSEQFVNLLRIRDLPLALLLKSILDSEGIECYLSDENLVRMDWLWSNLLEGVKLWVRLKDVDDAALMVDQNIPESFAVEGIGEYIQPRCPTCNSFNVSFEALNRPIAYSSLFFGLAVPLKRQGWKCLSCGRAWMDPPEPVDQTH